MREGGTAQIGRDADNDLFLSNPGISRRHAVVAWREGGFEIADLGSMNGTQVNGEPISMPRVLRDGDVVHLHEVEVGFFEISPTSPEANPAVLEAKPGREPTFVVPADLPRPRLIVSAGPDEGREIPLPAGTSTLGRMTARGEGEWDIALQDRSISRPHAQIEKLGDSILVTDQGSANGTWINGEMIQEPTRLQDGDVVVLGETTMLFRSR
jgi:pSer/pThr/pTyr-binding forkhead associated (FHA) protein